MLQYIQEGRNNMIYAYINPNAFHYQMQPNQIAECDYIFLSSRVPKGRGGLMQYDEIRRYFVGDPDTKRSESGSELLYYNTSIDGVVGIIGSERDLFDILQSGDVLRTSTLLNFSQDLGVVLKKLYPLIFKEVVIRADYEEFYTDFDTVGDSVMRLSGSVYLFERNKRDLNMLKLEQSTGGMSYMDARSRKYRLDEFPQFEELYTQYKAGSLLKKDFADKMNLSRPTLNKLIEEYEKSQL